MKSIRMSLKGHLITAALSAVMSLLVMSIVVYLECHNLERLQGGQLNSQLFDDIVLPLVFAFPGFYVLVWKFVQLEKAKRLLEDLAYTDSLTGLLNRRAFQSRVEAALRTGGKRGHAMLLLDLDHFKRINDHHGHDFGDKALMSVAQALAGMANENVLAGRIGGEEFVLFLTDATPTTAMLAAERARRAIEQSAFSQQRLEGKLTASIGLVQTSEQITYDTLYREADACLYRAKAAGRNRVVTCLLDNLAGSMDETEADMPMHLSYAS